MKEGEGTETAVEESSSRQAEPPEVVSLSPVKAESAADSVENGAIEEEDDEEKGTDSEAETERIDMEERKRRLSDDSTQSKKRRVDFPAVTIAKTANGKKESNSELEEEEEEEEEAPRKEEYEEEDNENDPAEVLRQREQKEAIALLTEIEIDFAKLRDKLHEDKMARYVAEIEMCADGTHPELARVAEQIEKVRDDKIRLARAQRDYQRRCIDIQTHASRDQLHQQYFKEQADVRASLLLSTTEEWYRVNRERRAMDALVHEYSYRARPDEMEVFYRQDLEHEISLLCGIKREIGFPAAPEVVSASPDELEEDLYALGLRQAI
ncbi:transcriptional regulatory protein Dep1p [Trichomonascus vanleenenianus]|uniref:Rpd3L histone deacetylase complex subunit DEP1 n=1 Tax=Trichomonascus vanleenenianus TaxID=2268995 RepID=UPI003ECADFAD